MTSQPVSDHGLPLMNLLTQSTPPVFTIPQWLDIIGIRTFLHDNESSSDSDYPSETDSVSESLSSDDGISSESEGEK